MIERDREELNEEVILLYLWKFKTPTLSKMYFSIFLTLLVKIELKIKYLVTVQNAEIYLRTLFERVFSKIPLY